MYETNYQIGVSRKDKALRSFFSQPKFLWLAIAGFASVLLSCFSGPLVVNGLDFNFLNEFSEYGLDAAAFDAVMPVVSIFSIVFSIISSAPALLIAVAFLLFHLNAKNPEKNFKVPATILNVLALLSFILSCILAGFLVLLLIIMAVVVFATETGEDAAFVVFILGFIAVIYITVAVFTVLISRINLNFTKSLKISTTTEEISLKGVKGYSVILILNLISMGFSAVSSLSSIGTSTMIGFAPIMSVYYISVAVVGFVYYLLMYQFVSGFGKILEAEQLQRTFESAPYNQPAYREVPVTGIANDNQRPFYDNPYTAPETENQQAFCRYCGKALNRGDSFCTSCGAKIDE